VSWHYLPTCLPVAKRRKRAMLRVGTYKGKRMPPMTSTQRGRLFRARQKARAEDNVTALARAAIAIGIGKLDNQTYPSDYIKRTWDDHLAGMVLRAATTPATLAGNAALARVAVSFLEALVPLSAGADLLLRGLGLNFNGAASIRVPGITIPTADFVAEGAPIPAPLIATSSGPTLTPFKIAALATLTNEMMRSPNAVHMVRAVLIESAGPAIDKVLFSANAAGTDRPAGLLNGIAALTPASGASGKDQIIVDDLQALATAIASVSGNSNIVIVASPDAGVALQMRVFREEWPILVSTQLPARTVVMVAVNAVVSAIEGAPTIDASAHAELAPDTIPQEIVTAAGAVTIAATSPFQMDKVALRLRWPIAWALRASNGVAWMTNVNW